MSAVSHPCHGDCIQRSCITAERSHGWSVFVFTMSTPAGRHCQATLKESLPPTKRTSRHRHSAYEHSPGFPFLRIKAPVSLVLSTITTALNWKTRHHSPTYSGPIQGNAQLGALVHVQPLAEWQIMPRIDRWVYQQAATTFRPLHPYTHLFSSSRSRVRQRLNALPFASSIPRTRVPPRIMEGHREGPSNPHCQ